ncbi:MAG TPA: sigma-70 family RNA polymerase sigma factor [Gaiellaceae bacterium]|nr:sigma-70 family RNA polymerase sigma factor [Gaiellaceae bacterium]
MATVARTPDAELLRRLRARDRQAWDELYAEYQPRLRAFGYRLAGNVHDADDLVQETFVRAVPRLDQLDPDTAEIAPYLFTTLRNLFLKQVERQKRQQPVADVPEPALPTPIEDDPERRTLLSRQQDEVRIANARLQPRQRLVLALRELEERSYAEIGELVGMKENAVAQLIFRARESLRTELRLAQVDRESLPEECRRFLPLLAAHLDGQLKGARSDETLAHLDGCERCQAALADMREASRRYRFVLLPLGTDDARAAVSDRLESSGYWTSGPGRRRRLGRRPALVALGVVGALVLGGGGAALGLALTDGTHQRALRSSTPPPRAAPVEVVSGSEAVETEPAPTVAAVSTSTPKTTTGKKVPIAPMPKPKPVSPAKATTPAQQTTTAPEPPVTTAAPHTTAQTPKPAPKKPQPAPSPAPPPAPAPDTTLPAVTITSGPAAATQTDSADVAFSAGEDGVTFACSLDAAAFAACSSPVHLGGLAPGPHTFSVRGTDKAGNVGQAASTSWTYTPPDTTPPAVTIGSGPSGPTYDTSATFTFTADEAGSAFQCSLDGGAFSACSSPAAYSSLAAGPHSFSVRATDQAGNTGGPATRSWTVERPLPDLVIGAFSRSSITVTNRGNARAAASVLSVTYVGTFTVPALAPGASATFTWTSCRTVTYVAVADRGQAVAESDESNNTASLKNSCR